MIDEYETTLRALNPARTKQLLDNPQPWPEESL